MLMIDESEWGIVYEMLLWVIALDPSPESSSETKQPTMSNRSGDHQKSTSSSLVPGKDKCSNERLKVKASIGKNMKDVLGGKLDRIGRDNTLGIIDTVLEVMEGIDVE